MALNGVNDMVSGGVSAASFPPLLSNSSHSIRPARPGTAGMSDCGDGGDCGGLCVGGDTCLSVASLSTFFRSHCAIE